MSGLDLVWDPPGPVAEAFMNATGRVQIINGPIGSGKTTTKLMKGIALARQQAPSPRHTGIGPGGVRMPLRMVKACVVRDTYRNLWRSEIQSWFKRVPREVGTFKGGDNAPATHHIRFAPGDGTLVDFIAEFGALGEHAVEDFMRGYEPTFFLLGEIDLLPPETIDFALGRAGRYPDMADGGPTWRGVIGDCNAPELDGPFDVRVFQKTEAERQAEGIELFRQPGGRAPGAENLKNLPPGYYADQVRGNAHWYVRRMIDNVPGYSREGEPVYPEFNDDLHVAKGPIAFDPGLPLIVGLDGGMQPSAVFMQRPWMGWRVLRELVTTPGTGVKRFSDMLSQALQDHFAEAREMIGYSDPSSDYGADRDAGELSWREIVAERVKLRIRSAQSNNPLVRWEAVRLPLASMVEGRPSFQLDPGCVVVRAGFNAGYHYRKRPKGEVADTAEKNKYSHPHDALQYGMLGGGDYAAVRGRGQERRAAASSLVRPQADWSP